MRNFIPAKKRIEVSPGESVRIIRELQGLTQTKLSALCGIPQTVISAIETGRVNLGVERAKTLATALDCHPAVLVFPGWQIDARPFKKESPKPSELRGILRGIDTNIEREDDRM